MKRAENREHLRMNGVVVHLRRSLDALAMDGRPLSKDRTALEKLWQERAGLYEACADLTVDNNSTPEACAQTIKEGFDEALCD